MGVDRFHSKDERYHDDCDVKGCEKVALQAELDRAKGEVACQIDYEWNCYVAGILIFIYFIEDESEGCEYYWV